MSTTQSRIQTACEPTQTLVKEVTRMWEQDISPDLDESSKTHFEPLFAALVSRVQGKVESEQGIYSGQTGNSGRR